MFVRQTPSSDLLLFQKQQLADNWMDVMNTQDKAQKTHVPLGLSGNHNSDIFEQNITDTTATPAKSARSARIDIPPMPASYLQRIAKRHQNTQLQLLQDQMNHYQMMDVCEHIIRASRETDRKLLTDSLLNRATNLSAQ